MAGHGLVPDWLFSTSLPKRYKPIVLSDDSDCSSISAVSDDLQSASSGDSTLTPISSLASTPTSSRESSPSSESTRSTLSYRPSLASTLAGSRETSLSLSSKSSLGAESTAASTAASIIASELKTLPSTPCSDATQSQAKSLRSSRASSQEAGAATTRHPTPTHTSSPKDTDERGSTGLMSTLDSIPKTKLTDENVHKAAPSTKSGPQTRRRASHNDEDKKPWLIEKERHYAQAAKRRVKKHVPPDLTLFVRIGNKTQRLMTWGTTSVYSVKVSESLSVVLTTQVWVAYQYFRNHGPQALQ